MKQVGTLTDPPTHSILTDRPIAKAGAHTLSLGDGQIVRYESSLAHLVTDEQVQEWKDRFSLEVYVTNDVEEEEEE